MRTTFLVLGFVLFGLIQTNAQDKLSSYKYVIVPTTFNSFKQENQYQTSTLVKFHLVNRGFNAVYANALPPELSANRCMAVTAELVDESKMFTTKAHISFRDCNSVEVYRTPTISTKIKEYDEAYKEIIRRSFQSLNGYTYSYKPSDTDTPIVVSFGDDVKTLEPEPVSTSPVEEQVNEVPSPESPAVTEKEAEVEQSVTPAMQEKDETTTQVVPVTKDNSLWYAQAIPNGFQLVDNSPKVQLRIYKTQKNGVYLAKGEENEGIVYEDQGNWYFDYYSDGELVHQMLNIKF